MKPARSYRGCTRMIADQENLFAAVPQRLKPVFPVARAGLNECLLSPAGHKEYKWGRLRSTNPLKTTVILGGYCASWKITPMVKRWPERTRLTPWRIFTR